MYVRKEPYFDKKDFPQNYNGSLRQISDENNEIRESLNEHVKRYKIKRNKAITHKAKNELNDSGNIDDLILIGALAFLYIGCEHTKENLILMAVLAYLLFICKNDQAE